MTPCASAVGWLPAATRKWSTAAASNRPPCCKTVCAVVVLGLVALASQGEETEMKPFVMPTLEAPAEMEGRDLLARDADRGAAFAEGERGEQYMVRTERRKLLVRRDEGTCRLFDLEEDPLELHDVYDDPAYRREREELRQRLFEWALFESRGGSYLDEDAPVIDRPNVPKDREAQRAASRAYFQP